MVTQSFFEEVDQRLEENKALIAGGLPGWLRPGGSVVGLHSLQALLLLSLFVTVTAFVLFPGLVARLNTLFFWWL